MSDQTLPLDQRLALLRARGVELRFAPSGGLQLRDPSKTLSMAERTFLRDHAQEIVNHLLNAPAFKTGKLDDTVARCDRCGGVKFIDIPIHHGQSLRRDCVNCGRTAGLPRWYGVDDSNLRPFDDSAATDDISSPVMPSAKKAYTTANDLSPAPPLGPPEGLTRHSISH